MKLSKAEIISIIITVLFMFSAAAVTLNKQDSASVTVRFEHIVSASENGYAPAAISNPSKQENVPIDPVNINTATNEELCELPGIGEVLAGRIVAYRTEHGEFKRIDEIMNVSGIGTGKFEKIKNSIMITQTGGSQ